MAKPLVSQVFGKIKDYVRPFFLLQSVVFARRITAMCFFLLYTPSRMYFKR